MQNTEYRRKTCDARRRGMTLIEIIVSLTIMAIIFAVIVPQFVMMRNSWASKEAATEVLQNGRILLDHLERNLSKAVRITDVSSSSTDNGYIQFLANDGNNYKYDMASNYIRYGIVGSLYNLAGLASQLQFSCYDTCDLDTPLDPVTDANIIRSVKAEFTVYSPTTTSRAKTFTVQTYLRTNSEGPVGRWKLDETSGLTAVDSGIFGNDGTLTNMVGDEWTTGRIGGALAFDGTNDYVTIPDGAYLHTENLSISFWVKTSQTGSSGEWYKNPLILEKDTPGLGNDGFGTGLNNQKLEFVIGDSVLTSNRSVSDGAWHYIVLTKDSSKNTAIYIDGSLDNSGVAIYNFTNTAVLHIAKPLQGAYFNGIIDDVRIYNRVLSAEEILTPIWELNKGTNVDFYPVVCNMDTALTQIDSTHYLCVYAGEGSDGHAVVLTVDANLGITAGTPHEYDTSDARYPALAQIDSTNYLCVYRGGSSYIQYAIVLTVDTGTCTVTERASTKTPTHEPVGFNCKYPSMVKLNDCNYLCVYSDNTSGHGHAEALRVDTSNWTITSGDPCIYDIGLKGNMPDLARIDNTHCLCVYYDNQNPYKGDWAVVLMVDANLVVTKGTALNYDTSGGNAPAITQIDDTHYLTAYSQSTGYAAVLTVNTSDWTISKGDSFQFDTASISTPALAKIDSTHYLCIYSVGGNGWAVILTVNTSNWTVSKEQTSLEWDSSVTEPALAKVNTDVNDALFLCAYKGASSHGWSVMLSADSTPVEAEIHP